MSGSLFAALSHVAQIPESRIDLNQPAVGNKSISRTTIAPLATGAGPAVRFLPNFVVLG
jgi:hypothetical protein